MIGYQTICYSIKITHNYSNDIYGNWYYNGITIDNSLHNYYEIFQLLLNLNVRNRYEITFEPDTDIKKSIIKIHQYISLPYLH